MAPGSGRSAPPPVPMAKKKQKAPPRKPKPRPPGKPGKKPGGGEAGWRGGEHELRAALAARSLRIKAVQSDGNCFFRAVGDQLEGDAGVLRHLECVGAGRPRRGGD